MAKAGEGGVREGGGGDTSNPIGRPVQSNTSKYEPCKKRVVCVSPCHRGSEVNKLEKKNETGKALCT